MTNPLLSLPYETALESLGDDYYDVVAAAEFPQKILRWRNDAVLTQIGLEPSQVTDDDFIAAFGEFQSVRPLLALRYHGYQFGEYNPQLGDGRGFLYGQVRGIDQELYDFGTKGSGRTPYSRQADGFLTLKGGVREVLAAEALHRMGVRTSRCLSVIETGLKLWRGDEPSPTRSSVMVRFSRSHIRFGTFERLHWFGRDDLIRKLLDHVISIYYPHLWQTPDQDAQFYRELVQRVATLTAQWMAAGFCHAVLNTDNMSITGESFDYGPYAFMPYYNPQFTAAYFDYGGRYCYGNQPGACYWNLSMLQAPLKLVMAQTDLNDGLEEFKGTYQRQYCELMVRRLGFDNLTEPEIEELLDPTFAMFSEVPEIGYNQFFVALREGFSANWREDLAQIAAYFINHLAPTITPEQKTLLEQWATVYQRFLLRHSMDDQELIKTRLTRHNPQTILLRPVIETVWEAIAQDDNWEPFNQLVCDLGK
ncbi:MAG: protein adenylyltransferase SelO [Pseudanabaenaceae cyanobacterium]